MSKGAPMKKSWSLRRRDQRQSGEFEGIEGEGKLMRIPDELFNKSVRPSSLSPSSLTPCAACHGR